MLKKEMEFNFLLLKLKFILLNSFPKVMVQRGAHEGHAQMLFIFLFTGKIKITIISLFTIKGFINLFAIIRSPFPKQNMSFTKNIFLEKLIYS